MSHYFSFFSKKIFYFCKNSFLHEKASYYLYNMHVFNVYNVV